MKQYYSRAEKQVEQARVILPGLSFCVVLAAAATFLSQSYGGPTILYALLLGMAFQFLSHEPRMAAGVAAASRDVLRLGVGLLGARITADQVMAIGLPTMLAVLVAVVATIGAGFYAARAFGLPGRFGVLSAGATAICGASAAAALSSVLPHYPNLERDTAFTIVGVTTLSTIAMVSYPAVAKWMGFSDTSIGIILGATIHDVAQVVGAGYSVSVPAGDVATIVKLFRVALLLPLVIAVAVLSQRFLGAAGAGSAPMLPWFLVMFAVLMLINSLGLVPPGLGAILGDASRWCIVVAIAGLGVKTALKSFFDVGPSAILLMTLETVFLAGFFLLIMLLIR